MNLTIAIVDPIPCSRIWLSWKSTANRDECGCHARISTGSVAGHMSHTMPTAIDQSSPMHLLVVGKPRNEG